MFAGLKELRCFLRDGMTVETADAGRLAMRTVIQLDGDVMTFVAPAAVDQAVRTRHSVQVEARLKVVSDRLNGTALVPTWCFACLYLAGRLWEMGPIGDESAWVRLLFDVGVSVGISVLGVIPAIRRLAWKLAVWTLRQRLDPYATLEVDDTVRLATDAPD